MRYLKGLSDYDRAARINESVVGKYTTLSQDELDLVKDSQPEDLGSEDDPTRAAIIKALKSALKYFNEDEDDSTNTSANIVSKLSDVDMRDKLHGLAQTYVASLDKIRGIETGEIEPIQAQIEQALQ